MSNRADARTALVTGATRGLGRETARQLIERGWSVWVAGRSLEAAQGVAGALGDRARPVRIDVTDLATITEAFAAVAAAGPLHSLINNAGVDYDTDQRAATADLARVRTTFETNLFGAWACAQAAIPLLTQNSHATLVNVSSEAGSLADMAARPPGYSASKAALNALTRILAAELRDQGTLVNSVCPGWTATDMGRGGRPVPEGAKSIVWAAVLEPGGPTSGFFLDGRPLPW